MDWRDKFRKRAEELGRTLYEHPTGVGLEFPDGCDAFWVLPGEVTSTVPVPAEGPASTDALLAAYDTIGRVRERALHVVRHYIASKKIRLDPRASGAWGLTWEDSSSSSVAVGAYLTAVARDSGDVYEVVKACVKSSWIGKAPSRRRIDRYLATPGLQVEGPQHPAPASRSSIRQALAWMGVCHAMDHAEEIQSADDLRARAAPSGRIGQTFLRVAERLPDVEAWADLGKPGTLSVQFDDGYASFEIDSRSRVVARRISAQGALAAGDELADEFVALNEARSRALRAIQVAAAGRGWHKQEVKLALFRAARLVQLGEARVEVSFDPGDELTRHLRGTPPDEALRQIFSQWSEFAEACVAALNDPAAAAPVELREAELAPASVPPAPPLRTIDASLAAELDRFAAQTLRAYLAEPRTIWDYVRPEYYDAAIDTWATRGDWVRIAEKTLHEEWVHPMAVRILLDAGDPRGDALARRYLARAEVHEGVGDADVDIVWRYRHEFPEVARRWFSPSTGDDVPFAKERAKLGDPVAVRFVTVDNAEEDPQSDDSSLDRLDGPAREELHRTLTSWARNSYRWSPPDSGKLRAALRMGWRDVADELENNPYLRAGLLTRERRTGQFDEPGMLLAKDFLLTWSRLSPGPFLARLIATACHTDLLAAAEEASRESLAAKPQLGSNPPHVRRIYESWLKDTRVVLAIAWTRCRA